MDTEEFKKLVAEYIGYDASSGKYNEEKMKDLACRFGASKPTVIRWATVAGPHRHLKPIVIAYIRRPKDFKEVVAEYIEYKEDGLHIMWSEEKVKILVDEFESIRRTVVCWASGLTNPRKGTKELVIRYINAQKK